MYKTHENVYQNKDITSKRFTENYMNSMDGGLLYLILRQEDFYVSGR